MKARRAIPVLLMLATGMASAQVYKWKDEKGVTHFSDTPPPATAKQAAELKTYAGATSAPALPYELQTVVRDHPVTLYTTGQCDACNQGRAQLRKRGIPYTEKTVLTAADMDALQRAGGNGRLPLLVIGRTRQTGYDKVTWDEVLSNAGYPAQSMLPSGYAYSAATPAAPPPAPTGEPQDTAAPKTVPATDTRRAPPVNAPPGFQF